MIDYRLGYDTVFVRSLVQDFINTMTFSLGIW